MPRLRPRDRNYHCKQGTVGSFIPSAHSETGVRRERRQTDAAGLDRRDQAGAVTVHLRSCHHNPLGLNRLRGFLQVQKNNLFHLTAAAYANFDSGIIAR